MQAVGLTWVREAEAEVAAAMVMVLVLVLVVVVAVAVVVVVVVAVVVVVVVAVVGLRRLVTHALDQHLRLEEGEVVVTEEVGHSILASLLLLRQLHLLPLPVLHQHLDTVRNPLTHLLH